MLSDEKRLELIRAHGTGGWQTVADMDRFARAVAEAAVKDAVGGECWGLYDPVTNEAFKVDGHSALTQEVTDRCIPLYTRPQASAAVPEEARSAFRELVAEGHQVEWESFEYGFDLGKESLTRNGLALVPMVATRDMQSAAVPDEVIEMADRFMCIAHMYNGMKRSTAERFLDCLGYQDLPIGWESLTLPRLLAMLSASQPETKNAE